uniref:EGF-like domain-containing protein n=1 Tax=Globodera pallida TaxID=36090 RepID=A0A183CC33_GLOPA
MSIVVLPKSSAPTRPFRSDGGGGGLNHRLRPFVEQKPADGILDVPPPPPTSTAQPNGGVRRQVTDDGAVLLSFTTTTTMAPSASSTGSATESSESSEEETDRLGKKPKTPLRSSGNGLSIGAVWEGVKRMMGFTAECHNGGYKTIGGDCICPQFFEGKACERIVCAHNGTRVRVAAFGGEEVCKCAHPQYISGKHCEVVHCQNGGRVLNDGTCHCVDGWYTGQFCQFYTSSWLIAFGVPLLVIAAIVFCCVICRLDLCALRRTSPPSTARQNRRPNGRRTGPSSSQAAAPVTARRCRGGGGAGANRSRREQVPCRGPLSANGAEMDMMAQQQQFFIQQNLLNDRDRHHNQQHQQQYVLRLEQIPVYNPRMFNAAEPAKPLEPPPPYEQAIRCPPHHQQNHFPPNYSPAQPNEGGDGVMREVGGANK